MEYIKVWSSLCNFMILSLIYSVQVIKPVDLIMTESVWISYFQNNLDVDLFCFLYLNFKWYVGIVWLRRLSLLFFGLGGSVYFETWAAYPVNNICMLLMGYTLFNILQYSQKGLSIYSCRCKKSKEFFLKLMHCFEYLACIQISIFWIFCNFAYMINLERNLD